MQSRWHSPQVTTATMMMPTMIVRLPFGLTALRIWPATTESIIEYPSRLINVKITANFVGHQPMTYLVKIMVRFPD